MEDTTQTQPSDAAGQDVPHETDRGPSSGATTRTVVNAEGEPGTTDRQIPNPELIGQYDRENILSYGGQPEESPTTAAPESQQPRAFDLQPAFDAWQSNPQATPQDFWQALPQQSQLALANHVIDAHAEQILESLVNAGLLPPESLFDEPRITPEMLREIPRDLREVAATLSPEAFEELALLPPHLRDQYLEERRELEDFRRQEVERQAEEARQIEQETQKQFDGILAKGAEATNNLVDEHLAGHYLHLEQTFSPFADKQANRNLHESILALTMAQVMQDPEARVMDHNIHAFLAHAAFEDAVGKLADSLRHRNLAHDLAKRLNARIAPVRDAYINLFRSNFAGAHQPSAQTQPEAHLGH